MCVRKCAANVVVTLFVDCGIACSICLNIGKGFCGNDSSSIQKRSYPLLIWFVTFWIKMNIITESIRNIMDDIFSFKTQSFFLSPLPTKTISNELRNRSWFNTEWIYYLTSSLFTTNTNVCLWYTIFLVRKRHYKKHTEV